MNTANSGRTLVTACILDLADARRLALTWGADAPHDSHLRKLGNAFIQAHDFAKMLAGTPDLDTAEALAEAVGNVRACLGSSAVDRNFAGYLDRVEGNAAELVNAFKAAVIHSGARWNGGSQPAKVQSAREPTQSAVWITQAVAKILPVSAQQRYAEEFRSELFELASDVRVGRWGQFAYLLQLVSRAWSLRNCLTAAPVSRPTRIGG